jgi:hypothetical protein
MRTTVTLEDDLDRILRRRAQELGKPLKEVINMTLRKGLSPELPATKPRVIVRPHDFGEAPGLDFDRLNQFADKLEAEEHVKEHRPR